MWFVMIWSFDQVFKSLLEVFMKRLLCGSLTAMLISLPLYAGGGSATQTTDEAQKMEDSSAVGTESMDESSDLGTESEEIQKMEDSEPVETESSDIQKMEDSPSLDSATPTDEVQMEEEDPSMMDS